MRKDIRFQSQGLSCAGWLYTPDGLNDGQRRPAIVMAHGFSAVKEMALPSFAERFAAAGLVTMVFDFRYLGESEGEPRGQIFPLEQAEDYRNAITWLSEQPQVDPARIGVWGSSFSGGVVLHAATFDQRIKAVVAQVPAASSYESRRSRDPEAFDRAGEALLLDRIARYRSGVVNYRAVTAPAGEPCVIGDADAYEWFTRWGAVAPTWRNQVTVESLEKMREFDPISLIQCISPTPLLLIAAERDRGIPLATVQANYDRAGEPKDLVVLPCGHFEIYEGQWGEKAAGAAIEWFRRYL